MLYVTVNGVTTVPFAVTEIAGQVVEAVVLPAAPVLTAVIDTEVDVQV